MKESPRVKRKETKRRKESGISWLISNIKVNRRSGRWGVGVGWGWGGGGYYFLLITDFVATMLFNKQDFYLKCLFFFWTSFDIWDCYYLDQISTWFHLQKCCLKKHITLFCSLLNMKIKLCHRSLFLCLSSISLWQYCQKNVVKNRGFRKGGCL